MHFEVVPPAGLLDLSESQNVEEQIVVEVVIDQDAADFVKKELLRYRINLAG